MLHFIWCTKHRKFCEVFSMYCTSNFRGIAFSVITVCNQSSWVRILLPPTFFVRTCCLHLFAFSALRKSFARDSDFLFFLLSHRTNFPPVDWYFYLAMHNVLCLYNKYHFLINRFSQILRAITGRGNNSKFKATHLYGLSYLSIKKQVEEFLNK